MRKWEDLEGGRLRIWTAVYENDPHDRPRGVKPPRFALGDTNAGEQRTISLPDECLVALAEQLAHVQQLRAEGVISEEAAGFMFPNRRGSQPFSNPAMMYERWRFMIQGNKNAVARQVAAQKAHRTRRGRKPREALRGVRFISLYGLRHTHATDLLRHGYSMKLVAERLGTGVGMIDAHYGHILEDMESAAIRNLTPLGYGPT